MRFTDDYRRRNKNARELLLLHSYSGTFIPNWPLTALMARFVFFFFFKRERSSRGPDMFLLLTVKKMLRFCARSFQQLQTTFTSRTSSSAKRKCGSREVHDVIKNNQAVLRSQSYVRIFFLWRNINNKKKEPVRDCSAPL